MSKQEEIIEVCGKKVVVRYAKDGAPCEKCVLNGIRGCGTSKCSRLDKVGMEIDERAYFVEAEQPEEKDYKRLYEELVNSEWYKKYYQGASVGDSVAVEQPEADLDAEIFAWQKARATEETKQIIAMTARHFAGWGAEYLKK